MLGASEHLIAKSNGYFPFIIFLDLSAKSNTINHSCFLETFMFPWLPWHSEKCPVPIISIWLSRCGLHFLYLPSNWGTPRFYLLCIHLLLICILSEQSNHYLDTDKSPIYTLSTDISPKLQTRIFISIWIFQENLKFILSITELIIL